MADHTIAAGRNRDGHVAVCICGWNTKGTAAEVAMRIGTHYIERDAEEPNAERPPQWVIDLCEARGVSLFKIGSITNGDSIWACGGDCSCWFCIDSGTYLDRYSFVTEDGWCQGQSCPCHDLPRQQPGTEYQPT